MCAALNSMDREKGQCRTWDASWEWCMAPARQDFPSLRSILSRGVFSLVGNPSFLPCLFSFPFPLSPLPALADLPEKTENTLTEVDRRFLFPCFSPKPRNCFPLGSPLLMPRFPMCLRTSPCRPRRIPRFPLNLSEPMQPYDRHTSITDSELDHPDRKRHLFLFSLLSKEPANW